MLCSYGCGQEATHQFKNDKWCCNKIRQRCPSMIKKYSESSTGLPGPNKGITWDDRFGIEESKQRKNNKSQEMKNNNFAVGMKHNKEFKLRQAKRLKGIIMNMFNEEGVQRLKILAIGAHYDDIEIGCSGTLKKHSDFGDEIHLVVFNPENERSGSSEVRLIEQQTSMHKLKIPLDNLKLIDSLDDDNKYEYMVATLDSYKPDILFLPWMNDSHQHHRKVSRLGQAVLRKRNIQGFYYYSGSSVDFQANVYSRIDNLFKSALLKSFSSQIKNKSLNYDLIMDYNKYSGSQISDDNSAYAEPFHIKRMRYPFD